VEILGLVGSPRTGGNTDILMDVVLDGAQANNHWCGPTGPMKLLVDRLRPYVASGRLKGKKGIVVAPAKDGPGDADLLAEMFRRTFGFLGMETVGQVLGTAYDPRDILGDEQAMEQAAVIGKAL
jgi:multimeric flavodoxin WrbA